jgi:formylglycine-generating enzyme required for sulfatase activity/predicted Ser/Thr protein kinase
MNQCLNPICCYRNPEGYKFCTKCGTKLLLAQRYRALEIIGEGGFGRTFKAIDEHKPSQQICVIKQCLPQVKGTDSIQKASELFAQEAQQLEKLGKHPQIPELMAYFVEDDRQYLIQEFIDGKNLEQELTESGTFDELKIRKLLQDLLPVLEFVHKNNIIHRDIKPENIIHRYHDKKFILVDFGASKVVVNRQTSMVGTVIGSAEYTAPEQTMGKPKYASDLYSLGVTCIHLLTLISPFDLYEVETGEWVWRNYLVDNPISRELGTILDKLIAPQLKNRYQSATEVLAQLQGKASPQTVAAASNSTTSSLGSLRTVEFEKATINVKRSLTGLKFKFEQSTAQTKSFTVDLGHNVFLEMIAIPGGTFLMGSLPNEKGHRQSEQPQHQVTIDPFYMSQTVITQGQWQAIMGNNPAHFKGENRPVERVSWHNCVVFCNKLFKQTKLGFRLPSEAEWEYACRAGTTTPFYCGKTITTDLANYNGKLNYLGKFPGVYLNRTTEVKYFPANAFGLYDMHGNVWEWCADHWHHSYYSAPTDGGIWSSNNEHHDRVVRGGSWVNYASNCRCAFRLNFSPNQQVNFIGFRVVLSI